MILLHAFWRKSSYFPVYILTAYNVLHFFALAVFSFFLVYRTSLKHWRELSICHFAGFLLSELEIQMRQFAFKEKFYVFVIVAIAILGEYVGSCYYPDMQKFLTET